MEADVCEAIKLRKASGVAEVEADQVVASGKIGMELKTEICEFVLANESISKDIRL